MDCVRLTLSFTTITITIIINYLVFIYLFIYLLLNRTQGTKNYRHKNDEK